MRDRYEGRPRGHCFGATYDGITARNRPVLEAFPADWTDADQAARIVQAALRAPNLVSVSACIRSLRRHGLIEARAAETGPAGNWLRTELRRRA